MMGSTQIIDPVYLLQPLIVILIVVSLIVYWHYKKSFTMLVLLYSLLAYGVAIVIKIIFQTFTINMVRSANNVYILGIYYGFQTMLLEVGLAYLCAKYAISKTHMSAKDASGYGVGLAFWENGVLLGLIPLVNLAILYVLLATGGQEASQLYTELLSTQPALFYPPVQALPSVLLGILERTSSIMLHIAWGYLVCIAAFYKKNQYLLMGMPMGLVDFFVPFTTTVGVVSIEILFFLIALVSLALAVWVNVNLNKAYKTHIPQQT